MKEEFFTWSSRVAYKITLKRNEVVFHVLWSWLQPVNWHHKSVVILNQSLVQFPLVLFMVVFHMKSKRQCWTRELMLLSEHLVVWRIWSTRVPSNSPTWKLSLSMKSIACWTWVSLTMLTNLLVPFIKEAKSRRPFSSRPQSQYG